MMVPIHELQQYETPARQACMLLYESPDDFVIHEGQNLPRWVLMAFYIHQIRVVQACMNAAGVGHPLF